MEQRINRNWNGLPENEAYRYIAGDLGLGIILLCDHAENRIPEEYEELGLKPEALRRHIAYDPGIAGVTERLAAKLGAPALFTRHSRLLIDPNRGSNDPTQIMQISDGLIIPGNAGIDEPERERRRARFYDPYHAAIDALIDQAIASGRVPVLLAMHSFTPAWKGVPRPWHAGILWDRDDRLPKRLLAGLRALPGIEADENVPYSGELAGDTMHRHGTLRGLAHALVELRQDLLGEQEQEEWAERFATILRTMLDDADAVAELCRIQFFGSNTDKPDGSAEPAAELALRTELEAAAFRRLRDHLRARTDVQNLDLMELAGFCRNCLSNWYADAAAERGAPLSKDAAREIVYGMAYEAWKAKYQR